MGTLSVSTEARTDVIDIADEVAAALSAQADGVATVFVRHTTAAVTVNEAERCWSARA